MKKYITLLFISVLFTTALVAAPQKAYSINKCGCTSNLLEQYQRSPGLRDTYSQSFLLPRAAYDNLAAKQALWHNIIYDKNGKGAFNIISLYQDSIQSEKTQRYFLFNNKTSLTVRGDNHACDRDVRAEWLGITDADYDGTLTIDPQNRQFGAMIEYQRDLSAFTDNSLFKNMWAGIAMPVLVVENDMHLEATYAKQPTSEMTIPQAFNQCDWAYGKINGKQRKVGIPTFLLTLGTNFLNRDHHQVGMYSLFILPAHSRQKPTYMFNPVLGNNRHWGLGLGVQFQLRLSDYSKPSSLSYFLNIENQFFWRNHQYRTLDLINKPWSRYLMLNCLDGRRNIPAVNVLTLKVQASPFNVVDLSTGFRIKGEHFEAEFGYNLWAHGTEELLLRKDFKEIYGIAGQGDAQSPCPAGNCPTVIGATASESTISEQCADDLESGNPTFIPIKMIDLDMRSGARRSAITHKFHTSIGYVWNNGAFVGAGAFFEGPQRNTALAYWGAWVKLGAVI